MEREQFQQLIDRCSTAEEMTAIGREYITGSVIRDFTAAEGWLMRAIEAGDPVFSPRAMGILAREILGKAPVIAPEEIPELRRRAVSATGQEKKELETLLELI